MRIAIIGAGNVGGALGKGWARAGHAIVYGVPDPAVPKHLLAAKAAGATAMDVGAAVAGADAIVLAVPWDAVPSALMAAGDLSGRLLIDATNPLTVGPEGLTLALGFSTSGAEEVARLAPGAAVFKAMNQVGFSVMAAATGYPACPVMFVAGDNAALKPQVLALVADLGFDAVDAGALKLARLLEPYAMLWIDQAVNRGAPLDNAFAFMRQQGEAAVEYVRYVLTAHSVEDFIAAYTEAGRHLAAAPECLGYEITQCEDEAASFILRIRWASVAAHMEGFRRGPHFPPFLAAIRDFIPEIAEMRHYRQTGLAWSR